MIPHDEYLASQVMTATPQRLHLMLIEGAIRHCERTRQFWNAGLEEQAVEALTKAQEIVSELLASLNYNEQPDLASRIAGVYTYIFRAVVNASLKRDESSLAGALRVLEIERDTWREIVRLTVNKTEHAHTRTHAAHAAPAPIAMPDIPTSSFSAQA